MTPSIKPTRPRGQTLVLFALTLFTLALMVLITVGIGMRARERTEMQMVADAAAYSAAVATARTYNGIAIMNRGAVAALVATVGTQALISWSGQQYGAATKGCGAAARAAAFAAADRAAANQTRAFQGAAGALDGAGKTLRDRLLQNVLVNQQLANQMATSVNLEMRAPPAGQYPKEAADPVSGANSDYYLSAVTGSQGFTWVYARANGSASYGNDSRCTPIAGYPCAAANGTPTGVGTPDLQDGMTYATISGVQLYAHDHAGAASEACPAATTDDAYVMSSALEYRDDLHIYTTSTNTSGAGVEPGQVGADAPTFMLHSFGACQAAGKPLGVGCPGVFPGILDFYGSNPMQVPAAGNWGQPTLHALITRKLRRHPWDLFFNYSFGAASGTGTKFTNGLDPAEANAVLGTPVAISSGIAYYHRDVQGGENWKEPPTFFNPFWRATLVSPMTKAADDPGGYVTQAGFPAHGAVLTAVQGRFAGFRVAP